MKRTPHTLTGYTVYTKQGEYIETFYGLSKEEAIDKVDKLAHIKPEIPEYFKDNLIVRIAT